jgi:hypothetical protein
MPPLAVILSAAKDPPSRQPQSNAPDRKPPLAANLPANCINDFIRTFKIPPTPQMVARQPTFSPPRHHAPQV